MKEVLAVPVTTGTMPQIDPAQVPDFVMTDLAQTIYEEMLRDRRTKESAKRSDNQGPAMG